MICINCRLPTPDSSSTNQACVVCNQQLCGDCNSKSTICGPCVKETKPVSSLCNACGNAVTTNRRIQRCHTKSCKLYMITYRASETGALEASILNTEKEGTLSTHNVASRMAGETVKKPITFTSEYLDGMKLEVAITLNNKPITARVRGIAPGQQVMTCFLPDIIRAMLQALIDTDLNQVLHGHPILKEFILTKQVPLRNE